MVEIRSGGSDARSLVDTCACQAAAGSGVLR